MSFKKLSKLFFMCFSFNFLQLISSPTKKTKTVAEIAQDLIRTVEKVRVCESLIKREKSLQEAKYIEQEDLDDFEEPANAENKNFIAALKNFEAAKDAVDNYLKSETVQHDHDKTPE